jgi:4-amino-4-deoxy-L-arabinose transferase-like glycosyltransferase
VETPEIKPFAGDGARPGRDLRAAGAKATPSWRRICGNVYVQIAAAYAAVALVFFLNVIFVFSDYEGRTWFLPFNAYFDPRISWPLLATGAVAVAGAWAIFCGARSGKPLIIGAGGLAEIIAVSFAPGVGRNLPLIWVERFVEDAHNILRLPNPLVDVARVTELVYVHAHCRVRPAFVYWLLGGLDRLLAGNTYAIAIAFMVFAAASVPVLFYGARAVTDKGRALWAAALLATAPILLIFGSEPDGLNCLLATAIMTFGLLAATTNRPWPWAIAAGAVWAVALTTSYVLAALVLILGAFALAAAIRGRGWLRSLGWWVTAIGVALVALAAFQILSGYDHVAVFKRSFAEAQKIHAAGDDIVKIIGRAVGLPGFETPGPGHRQYGIYVFANLFTLAVAMGVPTAVLYARGLWRALAVKEVRRSIYGTVTLSFAAAFVAFNFSGLVLGEMERVGALLVPMFAVPAAAELTRLSRERGTAARAPSIILGLNVTQAFLYNLLFWSKF